MEGTEVEPSAEAVDMVMEEGSDAESQTPKFVVPSGGFFLWSKNRISAILTVSTGILSRQKSSSEVTFRETKSSASAVWRTRRTCQLQNQ
jgi:hypothetical protein